MCGVIYVGPKEVFNGTLEDNAIFLVYWKNVFAIKIVFLDN
jgi:hypothetical protein